MSKKPSIIDSLTLKQTLGTVPSGLFVVDTEMTVVYWNPAAERITGYSAEEAVGQHCSFLQGVPCGDGCGLFNPDKPKPIIGAHCTIVTKGGDTVHLLKNMEYLRNAEEEIIGGIESFINISRQNELEESLRQQAADLEIRVKERTAELAQSEARFRSALDNMDDMAYVVNEDYDLTFMNRAMQELFSDGAGKKCYQVLHDQASVCPWCPIDKVFKNRTLRDERLLGDNGRVYEIVHSPLLSEDGEKQKLAVCRDITLRKKAEKELQEANRELDAFAHSVSHDLRGILAPVVTYMDFLQLSYKDVFDEQIIQILGEVERQSERAIALLDDLLDLARVSHIEITEQSTDTNSIIDEIRQELAIEKKAHPHIISEKLPNTWLPEALTYQVFTNLINNACNYVPLESGPIEIGHWDENSTITFYVRDHGPGISGKETDSVFDIFYRGKTSKGKRGTGVGLAIVRKIALRFSGNAWVEKTPGGGATFCFSLPRVPKNSL